MPEPLRLAVLASRNALARIDDAVDDAVAALGLERAEAEEVDAGGVVDVVVVEVSKPSPSVSFRAGVAHGRGIPAVYVASDDAIVSAPFAPTVRYTDGAPRARISYKIAKGVEQVLVDASPPKVSNSRDIASAYRVGETFEGLVFHTNADGGYALVGDYGRKPAMLHISSMSESTRKRLQHGTLDPGDPIRVRVTGVNASKDQVRLAEAADGELTASERTSMAEVGRILYAWSLVELFLDDATSGKLALRWGTGAGMRLDEFRFVRNRLAHGDLVEENLLTRASQLADDLIQMAEDETFDVAWTREEIVEGIASNSEDIHGFTPDASVLCDVLDGDYNASAWARGDDHGHEAPAFGPETRGACLDCLRIWRYLPRAD